MSSLSVTFAVYGALAHGNENRSRGMNVQTSLQNQINKTDGVVNISNTTMGGDPSVDSTKHFGAIVERDGQPYYFACQENQTIDFKHGGDLNA